MGPSLQKDVAAEGKRSKLKIDGFALGSHGGFQQTPELPVPNRPQPDVLGNARFHQGGSFALSSNS